MLFRRRTTLTLGVGGIFGGECGLTAVAARRLQRALAGAAVLLSFDGRRLLRGGRTDEVRGRRRRQSHLLRLGGCHAGQLVHVDVCRLRHVCKRTSQPPALRSFLTYFWPGGPAAGTASSSELVRRRSAAAP
jgi:hypothetical protein